MHTQPNANRYSEVHIDYSEFRHHATIDYIEIRLDSSVPSNLDTVRKRLGVPYAKPLDAGPGGAATQFHARFYDLASWHHITESIERFTVDHPLTCPPKVTRIEVAFDAYHRMNNRDALAAMTRRFYKYATTLVDPKHRMTNGIETFDPRPVTLANRHIVEGFNIYVGNKGNERLQHIYLKEKTYQDGEAIPLPPSEHRARTEITLSGNALPLTDLQDWGTYDFTQLAGYFKFRKLKPNLNRFVCHAVMAMSQVGEKRPRVRQNRTIRQYSPATVADTKLNALAYSALRELTKRMNKTPVQMKEQAVSI